MSVNVHAILVGLLSVAHTPEQADHAARSVLDQHAHELAEQIRNAAGTKWDWWDAATIPDSCADLIDPKAQRAASTGDNA
ncbi:hypothetical protein E2C11_23180 [Streptomyces lavendulae]|nr:hypothetical protein [Streptomyces lavendulae]TXJ75418.1 hypothetical protein E2C11_23180 [Streptomyces lavendulae]